ncbi:MAG: flagellar basal body rod protein FlgB [Bacillota bacterium]
MNLFNQESFGVLEKSLTGLDLKNKAISNNIANVDTPNYKRKKVAFKEQLANAVEGRNDVNITNKRHIAINNSNLNQVQAQVDTEDSTSFRKDGNNVSVDHEMAELAKNGLEYRAIIKQISNQFNRIGSVIQKGGNA